MKKFTCFSLITLIIGSISLNSCKKDDPGIDTKIQGIVTGTGTPLGSAVSGTIGPSGGTIVMYDGKVEFVFPAGALSQSTDIVIQPVNSNIPLAIGNAYRLLPENTQFLNPVTLKYHYNPDELEGIFPEAIFIAHQNADGIWLAHGNVVTDTQNKTISAQLSHFSDWGLFSAYHLGVSDEIVDPDEKVELEIKEIPGGSLFFSLGQQGTSPIGNPVTTVGVTDFEIDQTQSFPASKGTITTTAGKTTYTAPSVFPSNTSFNLVKIIGKFHISPNQIYQMTREISLGGTVQFTVDGQSYYINKVSFVSTFMATGQSGLAAVNVSPPYTLTLPWDGIGVGHFISGGAIGKSETGLDIEDKNYSSHYFNCPGYKYLTTTVDVSSANQTSYVIRGTFNGTLCIINGETSCESTKIAQYREVNLTGYFRIRWAPI